MSAHKVLAVVAAALVLGQLSISPTSAQNLDQLIGGVIKKLGEAAEKGVQSKRQPSASDLKVQEWLIWAGDYGGPLDGEIGPGSAKAIKIFQGRQGFPRTGRLTNPQRSRLRTVARQEAKRLGFRNISDGGSGIVLPVATGLFDQPARNRFGPILHAATNRAWSLAVRSYKSELDPLSFFRSIEETDFAKLITCVRRQAFLDS